MLDIPVGGTGRAPHVAVFNVPMHGHVIPTLAVVRELVSRGHRVSYAVTSEFADDVRAVGAQPVLYEATAVGEAPEDMAVGVTQAVVVNVAALPELEAAFGTDVPDVVLSDVYAWAGPLLAARWGVPAVQLAPTHIPYDGLVREFFGLDDIAQIPGFPELAGALEEFGVPGGVHALTLAPPRTVAFFPVPSSGGRRRCRRAKRTGWGRRSPTGPSRAGGASRTVDGRCCTYRWARSSTGARSSTAPAWKHSRARGGTW